MLVDVGAYQPTALAERDWEKVAAFVRAVVEQAKADPNSPYVTKKLMVHVTAHVVWCHRIAGLPLDVSAMFDRDVISESCERAFPHLTTGTLATRRSALLFVAEQVLPQDERTTRLKPLRDDKLAMPYDGAEQLALRSWARGQTTPIRRRDCHTILALGLGAGLNAHDMIRLRVRDVQFDSEGVLVRVTDSKFPREVPVLWKWEQPLVDLVDTRDHDDLVLGVARTTINPNYLNYFISRTAPEAGLRPNSERLRNTWLLHHLNSGTPLGPLSVAAGLETFRTFEKLVRLLPEPTAEEVRRAMRRPLRAV